LLVVLDQGAVLLWARRDWGQLPNCHVTVSGTRRPWKC